jgi:hypothetical protein
VYETAADSEDSQDGGFSSRGCHECLGDAVGVKAQIEGAERRHTDGQAALLDGNQRSSADTAVVWRHIGLAAAQDPAMAEECDAVTPQMRAVLAKLDPYPACVQGAKYDLLAYNSALRWLLGDLDAVPKERRNCVSLVFTEPAWRKGIINWEETAARMVANLRVAMAEHVGDAPWRNLISRLRSASPEFAELWDRHAIAQVEDSGIRTFRSPIAGDLRFQMSNTWLAPRSGHRLQVFVPAEAETERRLGRLLSLAPLSSSTA